MFARGNRSVRHCRGIRQSSQIRALYGFEHDWSLASPTWPPGYATQATGTRGSSGTACIRRPRRTNCSAPNSPRRYRSPLRWLCWRLRCWRFSRSEAVAQIVAASRSSADGRVTTARASERIARARPIKQRLKRGRSPSTALRSVPHPRTNGRKLSATASPQRARRSAQVCTPPKLVDARMSSQRLDEALGSRIRSASVSATRLSRRYVICVRASAYAGCEASPG